MKFIKNNVSKGSTTSSKVITTYSNNSSTNGSTSTTSLTPHKIWGLTFDGTSDISGDLTNVGNITATGNIQTDGDIVIKLIDENGNQIEGGDLTISVDGNKATFSGKDEYVFDTTVSSDTVNANSINSQNITNSDTIKTKNLEVTGSAHFFELVIDKIKSAGGAALFTPANGFNVDIVETVTDGYKLYWLADDGDGNQADNMWKINDQAICQSFNLAKEGVNHNISNKYYWCLVTDVSDTNNPISIDDKKYHYITISSTTCDGTVNPEVGDGIAMLGYRGTDDVARQSAIYISAYSSLDSGLKAPLMAQYKGINDFSLASHRRSYWDATDAKFVGNFEVSSGESIEDYINQKIDESPITIYSPYIGTDGYWYVWDGSAYKKTDTLAEGSSIKDTSITYAVTTTDVQPSDSEFTYTSIPSVSIGLYVWTKTIVTYKDDTSTKTYNVSRIGADGTNGTTTHFAYSTSANGSQNFSTTIFSGATYIGSYTDSSITDSSKYTDYSWTKLKGDNGTSVTITSTSITYALTTSSSRPSDSSFTYTTMPSVSAGLYIWTKTIVTYSDNTSTKSYNVGKVGELGATGAAGTDGKSAAFIKLVGTSSGTAYCYIHNGTTLNTYSITSKGLTLFVIKRSTLEKVKQVTYNTYSSSYLSDTIATTMASYDNTYFLALVSYSGCSITSNLVNRLKADGASTATTWTAKSIPFVFLGVHNIGSGNGFIKWGENLETSQEIGVYITEGMYAVDGGVNFKIDQVNNSLTSQITEVKDSMVSSSVLEQKADSILAAVNDTYVKIGEGNITLNGDTQINGSLTLNSSDQGFVIAGSGGKTEIAPKSIGSYSSFVGMTTNTIMTRSNRSVYSTTLSNSSYYFTWTITQSLGTIASGVLLQFKNWSQTIYNSAGTKISNATGTFKVYLGSSVLASKTIATSYTVTAAADFFTATTTSTSEVKVVCTMTGYYSASNVVITDSNGLKTMPTLIYNILWDNIVPTSSGYTLIGYDGIGCGFGTNKNVYIGNEGFIANYGNYQLKVNSSGISQNNRCNVAIVSGSTYTVADPVDTVVCISGNCTVKFPASPYVGLKITVIDKSTNCYIHTNGKYLVKSGDAGTGSTQTSYELNSYNVWCFIYANNKWYEGKGG